MLACTLYFLGMIAVCKFHIVINQLHKVQAIVVLLLMIKDQT